MTLVVNGLHYRRDATLLHRGTFHKLSVAKKVDVMGSLRLGCTGYVSIGVGRIFEAVSFSPNNADFHG
jgi:hypothetical protein